MCPQTHQVHPCLSGLTFDVTSAIETLHDSHSNFIQVDIIRKPFLISFLNYNTPSFLPLSISLVFTGIFYVYTCVIVCWLSFSPYQNVSSMRSGTKFSSLMYFQHLKPEWCSWVLSICWMKKWTYEQQLRVKRIHTCHQVTYLTHPNSPGLIWLGDSVSNTHGCSPHSNSKISSGLGMQNPVNRKWHGNWARLIGFRASEENRKWSFRRPFQTFTRKRKTFFIMFQKSF